MTGILLAASMQLMARLTIPRRMHYNLFARVMCIQGLIYHYLDSRTDRFKVTDIARVKGT